MAKKNFATIGILALLLVSVGLVSAYASTQDNVTVKTITELPNPVSQDSTYNVEVNVSNNYGDTINLSWSDGSATSGITSTVPANDTIADSNTKTYTVTYSIPSDFEGSNIQHKVNLEIYNSTGDLVATFHPYSPANYTADSNDSSDTTTTKTSMCSEKYSGEASTDDFEIKNVNIDNLGEGSDDEWEYLDNIEIEVELENSGDDDIDDVEVQVFVYDGRIENGGVDVTGDFEFEDEVLDDIGRLKDDDEETVTFVIEELPSDIDDGTYYLYLVAYSDGDESTYCVSTSSDFDDDYYFEFEVNSVEYEDSVVVRDSELETAINAYCGQENIQIDVPVYNLGDDKEERVLVTLYNKELGIDEAQVIKNFDDGDKEEVTFYVSIPDSLSKDKYDLDITVYFDWDDEEDATDTMAYDEETSDSSVRINVLGCSGPEPGIGVGLVSESVSVGEELIVRTVVKNNGDESENFVFSVSGYESWADFVSTSPQTTNIGAGETQEVLITLKPTESGSKNFQISVIAGGNTYTQPVAVNVQESTGDSEGFSLGENALTIYLVVGIIALLLVILLILVIRALRHPKKVSY